MAPWRRRVQLARIGLRRPMGPIASCDETEEVMEYRPLGSTDLSLSAVALGCWPIAGMTSLDVNETDSLATIRACFELGVNFLDTAYAYGRYGESERLIAGAIAGRREEMI